MRFTKKRSRKAGLPPGTPMITGELRTASTRMTLLSYTEESCQEEAVKSADQCAVWKSRPGVTWLNIDGIQDLPALEKIAACYGLHPLVLEDIVNTDQRAKTEYYGTYLYIVLRMLRLDEKNDEVVSEQLSLILGENFVISFQEDMTDELTSIRERIHAKRGRVRSMPADYLAYAIMDTVVDQYFVILEKIGEKIEELEKGLIDDPDPSTLRRIHRLKRETILLRRSVWPMREVISMMQRDESSLIHQQTQVFLRDLYDHTIQVIDTVETYRDMLTGMLDLYLSSQSNRLNQVMKVLTIISTIFIPLTFIAGVYGMNFHYMPELSSPWGYPVVWAIMISMAGAMLYFFRRKKWF